MQFLARPRPAPLFSRQATPLPNVTVYYTGYRLYSHYRALQVGRPACPFLLLARLLPDLSPSLLPAHLPAPVCVCAQLPRVPLHCVRALAWGRAPRERLLVASRGGKQGNPGLPG